MTFEAELNEEPDIIAPGSNDDTAESGASEENDSGADISQSEEAVARSRGWVAKDEYRGDPSKWQDAKSFLDRNSSLQTELKELREKVSQQEEAYAERIRRIEAANERIIKQDRERLIRQIEEAKRQAVELGDTDEYDRLRDEETNLYRRIAEDERETAPPRETEQQPRQKLLPETEAWIARNSWFTESVPMQQIALGFYNEALEGMPAQKDETRRLAYVEKRMAEVYPAKFGKASGPSAVEGGTRNIGGGKITQLTAEERNACKRFIARGIIKNEAEYIKYLNEYE